MSLLKSSPTDEEPAERAFATSSWIAFNSFWTTSLSAEVPLSLAKTAAASSLRSWVHNHLGDFGSKYISMASTIPGTAWNKRANLHSKVLIVSDLSFLGFVKSSGFTFVLYQTIELIPAAIMIPKVVISW